MVISSKRLSSFVNSVNYFTTKILFFTAIYNCSALMTHTKSFSGVEDITKIASGIVPYIISFNIVIKRMIKNTSQHNNYKLWLC
ncbi:hypothetical protein HBA_0479 [Sodalis endosymbiont of Henestaris halophilus]|nr:hypothetical protein HBA_0479 [Sodalis endosymbiont of Henestaris halophilus]